MESLYIKYGKKLKPMELQCTVTTGKDSKLVKVLCFLRYFPYIQERETLPIPFKVLQEYKDIDVNSCPLTLRKPGFEIFWNGRLISDAHIERLGFMSLGKFEGEKIEEKWIQRVKGALFLSSDFPVTHNKMHIIKESPIFTHLIERSGSRSMGVEFKKWLLSCHKLDQDFQFEVARYNAQINRTHCKSISFGGTTYKNDDPVSLNVRPISFGVIKNIYFQGKPEQRTSDFMVEIDRLFYKQLPLETHSGSKIKAKLTKQEYDAHMTLLKNKLPSKIKLFEGDKVSLPKLTYHSGEKIRWLSVQILDRNQPPKEVEKKILESEEIKIHFTITYNQTNEVVYRVDAATYYQGSRASFKDIDVFKRSGTYIFSFKCSYPGVTEATHMVSVEAGAVQNIKANFNHPTPMDSAQFPIDKDLPPIIISQVDIEGNVVPYQGKKLPNDLTFSGEWLQKDTSSSASQKSAVLKLNSDFTMEIADGNLVVRALKVTSGEIGEESGLLKLQLNIASHYSCQLTPIHISAGPPVSMEFSETLFSADGEGYPNCTYLPDFSIILLDKDKNTCRVPPPKALSSQKVKKGQLTPSSQAQQEVYSISASSLVLKEDVIFVCDESGWFNVMTTNILPGTAGSKRKPKALPTGLFIQEQVEEKFESSENADPQPTSLTGKRKLNAMKKSNSSSSTADIQFTLYLGEKEIFAEEKMIKITPSSKPAHLQLYPMSDGIFADPDCKDHFRVISGTEIKFGVKVFSVGGGGRGPFEIPVTGQWSTNWTAAKEKFSSSKSNTMIILPPLTTDKITKLLKYSFSLAIDHADEQNDQNQILLEKSFSIQTTGGAPSSFHLQLSKHTSKSSLRCDSELTFEITLLDKKGNVVQPLNDTSKPPIEPYLILTETDIPPTKAYSIKNQNIGLFSMDKQCYVCKATIIGFGELILKVLDKSGQITEHSMKINVIEGQASQIKVNGTSKLSLSCSGGERLQDLDFTVCDSQGNLTRGITAVDCNMEWINNPSQNSGAKVETPFEIKSKLRVEKGEGKLRNLEINSECPEGVYQLNIQPKMALQPAIIFFNIKGKYSLKLLNLCPIKIHPSSPPPVLKLQLLDPDQQPVRAHKETFKLQCHLKSYNCTKTEQDDTIFVFDELKSLKKAGDFKLTFIHSDRGSLKLELLETLTVVPDPPVKLEIKGGPSGTISSTITRQPIIITAVDQHQNKCLVSGTTVKVYIETIDKLPINSPSQQANNVNASQNEIPILSSGNSEVRFNDDGEAIFSGLSVREGFGASGSYKLCFYSSQDSIAPVKVEFFFKNSKEIMDQKLKLQSLRVSLQNEIKDVRKEIIELTKEQTTIANKFDLLKSQGDELLNSLKQMIPEFQDVRVNQSPEEVKSFISKTSKEINDLMTAPRRPPTIPNNYLVRELSDQARSDEKSGIIGVVSDILCVDNEKEAMAFAKLIGKKFETVVISTKEKFDHVYRQYKNNNSPLYLISLDSILPFTQRHITPNKRPSQHDSNDHLLPLLPLQGAPLDGFKGYVVNIIELREKHEYLRKSLVWNLFKEAMVFNTLAEGRAYRSFLVEKRIPCPTILCIENGEVLEPSGFVEIGSRANQNHNQSSFGQIPIQDTKLLHDLSTKKSLLEEYKSQRHKQYQEKKNDYAPQLLQIKDQILQLESKHNQKQKELEKILIEINSIGLSDSNSSQNQ
ncbi:hypothetical protein DLAC_09445 [Tieghemostelium lacteum]|uniref:SMCHD1 ribosomal S5 domain-containing protein n=1 Tax=Tieghemostelium lacteum TaxID=361077 RepID=A0A151ZA90_TIELA|nr:hypothetical protein DLAC_09445 [Tieghemostelium lacteum]|eukprot:KYQ90804.1 hypothetical protein DLAC_09445 [Tieghemostelium lacteum]